MHISRSATARRCAGVLFGRGHDHGRPSLRLLRDLPADHTAPRRPEPDAQDGDRLSALSHLLVPIRAPAGRLRLAGHRRLPDIDVGLRLRSPAGDLGLALLGDGDAGARVGVTSRPLAARPCGCRCTASLNAGPGRSSCEPSSGATAQPGASGNFIPNCPGIRFGPGRSGTRRTITASPRLRSATTPPFCAARRRPSARSIPMPGSSSAGSMRRRGSSRHSMRRPSSPASMTSGASRISSTELHSTPTRSTRG